MLPDSYGIIQPDKKLKNLSELIKSSEKNIFAVVDGKERFTVIIKLNNIMQKLFQPDLFDKVLFKSIMKKSPFILLI